MDTPEQTVFNTMSTDRALWRILQNQLEINTVIDVGASDGHWSQACMRHLPESNYLLVEANDVHKVALENFCRSNPRARYVLAAAGDKNGECYFDGKDPWGGAAYNEPNQGADRMVRKISLDEEIKRQNLPGPYFVKLDTHGFEKEILNGSLEILRDTELLDIEAYVFHHNTNNLLFYELCSFLSGLGFAAIDFSEPLWRKRDMALWQFDLFFVKKSNPVFGYNQYQ